MIKKIVAFLSKQQKIPGAGEFVETLSLTLFWGTILNMVMNAGTFYYTTLRNVWPWFSLPKFVVVVGVMIVVAYVVTFKFIAPSIWQFRGRMMGPTGKDALRRVEPEAIRDGGCPYHGSCASDGERCMECVRNLPVTKPDYFAPAPTLR